MFVRLKRTAISFCAVLTLFWVYRLIAEPFIEPRIDTSKRVPQVSQEQRDAARVRQSQNRLGGYARFFPDGSWERESGAASPIILESETSKLLLKEYENQPGGRVKVTPCTVIYFPEGDAEAEESHRRVIILQAPQGARLQFDGDVDLSRGKLGKLLGGNLDGPVTIQSGATKPEGGDDLFVSTHDVQMKDNLIFTQSEVDFRFGPSNGHGRNMKIDLLPGPDNGAKSRGPNIGGIQSFELTNDVQMHLQPGSSGFMPGDRRAAQPSPLGRGQGKGGRASAGALTPALSQRERGQVAPANQLPQPPADIRCQGPFQFDLVAYVATFHDAVDVRRPNPLGGRNDQMNCELLSIFFQPREPKQNPADAKTGDDAKKAKSSSAPAGVPPLEPRRLEAQGNPVIVDAPSRTLTARAEQLQYDIVTGQIGLQSPEKVILQQETNQAEARSLDYTPGPDGGLLGTLSSDGPGWISAARREDPSQRFEARWTKKLTMLPQDENHVISLTGNAWVSYTGRGELAADEIHAWLYETPMAQRTSPPPRARNANGTADGANNSLAWINPVKMFADGRVRIESPQLSGTVKRIEAWFRDPASPAASDAAGANGEPVGNANNTGRRLERSPAPPRNAATPPTHYEIKRAGLLQAWLANGQQAQLEHVVLKDDVDFAQTATASDKQPPMEVIGDEVQVLRANTLDSEMTTQGHPAQVGAQGLTMFGQAVHVDRAANRLWIDGGGRMTWTGNPKPLNAGDAVNASAPPADAFPTDGPMDIDWRDKMEFDGSTATYEGDVVGHRVDNHVDPSGVHNQLTQTIRTPVLEVTLLNRVDFSAVRSPDRAQERPQMELMKCHGDVQLENRELADGHPAALEQMHFSDLVVNRITGEMTGQGPGRLQSWRLGPPPSTTMQPPGTAVNGSTARAGTALSAIPVAGAAASKADPNRPQINFLDVQFQRGITGNVLRRELVFHDQVRSLYGPVPAWDARLDPDSPSGLAPQSMLLTCDQLAVNETGQRLKTGRSPMEMEAVGNTRVDGQGADGDLFTAQAARLTYSEAKGMLVLLGDGRSDAQLLRQERAGAVPSQLRAGEIQYWPAERRSNIPSVRSINASQFATPRSNRPATQPTGQTKNGPPRM